LLYKYLLLFKIIVTYQAECFINKIINIKIFLLKIKALNFKKKHYKCCV